MRDLNRGPPNVGGGEAKKGVACGIDDGVVDSIAHPKAPINGGLRSNVVDFTQVEVKSTSVINSTPLIAHETSRNKFSSFVRFLGLHIPPPFKPRKFRFFGANQRAAIECPFHIASYPSLGRNRVRFLLSSAKRPQPPRRIHPQALREGPERGQCGGGNIVVAPPSLPRPCAEAHRARSCTIAPAHPSVAGRRRAFGVRSSS